MSSVNPRKRTVKKYLPILNQMIYKDECQGSEDTKLKIPV
jgi:hypothetical protein